MSDDIKPIRRVVTGNDAQGRSCVLFDSAAPNVNPGAVSKGTCMTDVWVYKSSPAPISGGSPRSDLSLVGAKSMLRAASATRLISQRSWPRARPAP